jgi:hypothetical protein
MFKTGLGVNANISQNQKDHDDYADKIKNVVHFRAPFMYLRVGCAILIAHTKAKPLLIQPASHANVPARPL